MSRFDLDAPPTSRKLSPGAKIGIGFGVVGLVILILVCAGVIFGARWGLAKLDDFAEPYEQQGYARVSTQIVHVTAPITQRTVYTAQIVNLEADVHADIAVMAQTVDIRANVNGDIDFQGQILTIHPGAVITGDVRAQGAQLIRIYGVVEGKVSGSYGTLDDQSPQGTTTTPTTTITTTDDTAPAPSEPEGDGP